MENVVDYAEAVRLAVEAADERGNDYTYNNPSGSMQCMYVHDIGDKIVPGCIVGNILIRKGIISAVELDMLEKNEHDSGSTAFRIFNGIITRKTGWKFTGKALTFLGHVQSRQDGGESWGDAISEAMAWTEELHYGRAESVE